MIATYDVYAHTLTLERSADMSTGADLIAALNRHGETINLTGVSFGFEVTANGDLIGSHSWPPVGSKYLRTNQDTLATYRVLWQPDQAIEVRAWVDSPFGYVEATDAFIAPRPPKPFESWTWADGWQAPKPMPGDGMYSWDEDAQEWVKW